MMYRYITKYRFDATKACLAKAAPGAVTGSRSLLDVLNYSSHFPGFQPKVRISAKRGYRLPVATSPLYTRQPEAASQLLDRYAAPLEESAEQEDTSPPPATAAPETPAFLDEEPVVAQRMPRMTVPLLSGIVAMAIAGGVGLAIGHANSFKLRTQDHSTASGIISIAPASVTPDSPDKAQAAIVAPNPAPIPPTQPATGTANAAPPASPPARELALAPDLDNAKSMLPVPAPTPVKKPKAAIRTARPAAAIASPSIQRPAADKPKEDLPQRRPAPSPTPPKPYSDDAPYQVTESSGTIRSYAKCQRLPSLFERERCSWQLCNKKWGKNGCPSFDHKTPPGIGGTAIAEEYMTGRVPHTFRPGSPPRLA